MAITFKLKYFTNGSINYIDLTDSSHGNAGYVPAAPDEGANIVSESGTFWIRGSSLADLISKVRAIEDLLRRAWEYDQDQVGENQIYLTAQLDASLEVWESPIFGGKLELPTTTFNDDWANLELAVTLSWTRGMWEYYMQVPLLNDNTSGVATTDNIRVYNCCDGSGSAPTKKVNNVNIESTAIPGDLPAPAAIIFYTLNPAVDQITVVQNANMLPTEAISWTLVEGETGSGDTTDTNRSGGKYHTYAIPAGTTGTDIEKSNSTLAIPGKTAWLRFFLSAQFNGTIKARPYFKITNVKYYGDNSILSGDGAAFKLYDLGLIRFPSSGRLTSGFDSAYVGINLQSSTGLNVDVDYFQFTPMDTWAEAIMDKTCTMILINSNEGSAYGLNPKVSSNGDLYNGIYLTPGKAQRLLFKFNAAGADSMAAYADLYMTCWARKKTL